MKNLSFSEANYVHDTNISFCKSLAMFEMNEVSTGHSMFIAINHKLINETQ